MKKILFLFLIQWSVRPLNGDGTSGLSYLNLDPAPRASALGTAYAAVAEGPQTVFYNPAGLTSANVPHLYTQTYIPPFLEDTKYHTIVYARPSSWGAWAIDTGIFYITPFTRTVADASLADGYREVGSFTTYDLKIAYSCAKEVKTGLSVGATLSFMRESLADIVTHGVALDLGGMYAPPLSPFRFGFSIQHIGPDIRFQNYSSPLPLMLRGGLALFKKGVLLTFELQKILYSGEFLASGVEIPLNSQLTLRSGYKYAFQKEHLASQWLFPNGFSVGLGLNKGVWSFDYATSSRGDLGFIHQIALDYSWEAAR